MKSMPRKVARAARHAVGKFAGSPLRAGWPQRMFGGNAPDPVTVPGRWFQQKLLRRTGHFSWPPHRTTEVNAPGRIQKGSRAPSVAAGCYLEGRNGIILGSRVWVGPHVSLISMTPDAISYEKYLLANPIRIDQGATVPPLVHLSPHTIFGAGAVVTKSFLSGTQLIGGDSADFIEHLAA